MNKYLKQFKNWFELRDLREKFFVCVLSWAFLYALFALIFYRPLDQMSEAAAEKIKTTDNQIKSWKTQLKFIKEIPHTALYKEWIIRHQKYLNLKATYHNLLGDADSKNWDNILRTVLSNYPNITIGTIHHTPETTYQASTVESEPEQVYQQQLSLEVVGAFQDIVGYLQYLEKTLPNIHWNTLNYDVKKYPIADVNMEFSVLYEKPANK